MFIYGKIMVEETAIGVPDLVVTLLQLKTLNDDVGVAERLRLGSVLTGPDGAFELTCETEDRPDLTLEVTTPENPAGQSCTEILHTACEVREDAGCTESFAIRIPRSRLEEVGIQVPSASPLSDAAGPAGWLATVGGHVGRSGEVNRGLRTMAIKELDGEAADDETRQQLLAPVLASMSTVPETLRVSRSFVGDGESVEQANRQAIRQELADSINTAAGRLPLAGVVALDAEQLARFSDSSGQPRSDVTAEEMDEVIFRRRPEDRGTTDLVRQDARAITSRRAVLEGACGLFGDGDVGGAATGGDAATKLRAPTERQSIGRQDFDAAIATLEDVPAAVTELLDTMTPPEQLDLDHRASDTDVVANIAGLALDSGPADVPAFYDFHHLQIAFEPMWQEIMDQRAIDLVGESYRELTDLGGRLDRPSSLSGGGLGLGDLRLAARQVRAYYGSEPPVVVLQVFEVEPATWQALTLEQRSTLIRLAERLAEPQIQSGFTLGLLGHMSRWRKEAARLRAMGERLLRYAELKARDGAVGYHRMHRLLEELDERLRTPYAFTLFAANRVERSINFGLLNTYRQYWKPITYQAGELVRTLTLAPKETRRFSHKTVTKRRRAVKEAESHTSATNREFSRTSRAEAEIAARAETKTNFSLSAEGDFNILLSKGTATSTFGTEAARSSSDVKKNFREAVVKSTQEYRDERKVEVDTEESLTYETSSSGEITNPNDELPVTYLFYELQRRYRISEQLHRVTPVVLVAQEVPAPHEIDEDWLVAHDWILQRVLLDDSYRSALSAISSRIVGDEYALEELRTHMLQQRDLADTLKEELAILRGQAGLRYASLERALDRRADIVAEDDGEGIEERAREWLRGSSGESEEAARLREDAAPTPWTARRVKRKSYAAGCGSS